MMLDYPVELPNREDDDEILSSPSSLQHLHEESCSTVHNHHYLSEMGDIPEGEEEMDDIHRNPLAEQHPSRDTVVHHNQSTRRRTRAQACWGLSLATMASVLVWTSVRWGGDSHWKKHTGGGTAADEGSGLLFRFLKYSKYGPDKGDPHSCVSPGGRPVPCHDDNNRPPPSEPASTGPMMNRWDPRLRNQVKLRLYVSLKPVTQSIGHRLAGIVSVALNQTMDDMDFYLPPYIEKMEKSHHGHEQLHPSVQHCPTKLVDCHASHPNHVVLQHHEHHELHGVARFLCEA